MILSGIFGVKAMSRVFSSSYQLVHLMKLRANGLRSCLSLMAGVGKTISAGYILQHFAKKSPRQPSLIVCPPILVDKWRWELKNRFGLDSG